MKLGTFMQPLHSPDRSVTEVFDEDTQFVVDCEKLGFTEAWCGHHVTLQWEPIVANDLFLANLIARTSKIRLGLGVSIMPQHHPANVAARVALLDHLSHGRVYWGFGQGGVPTDWELFGLPADPKIQGAMTREAHDIVLKLWTEDPPYHIDGDYWKIHLTGVNKELGMGYPLKPYQQPHPPIGMTLISAKSKGGQIGGARGYMPLSTNLVAPSTVTAHWETYCQGAAEAGLPEPNRDIWRVSRSIFVGESTQQAWDFCMGSAFGASFEYMIALLTNADMLSLAKHAPDVPDSDVTVEYYLKHCCIIGDRQECIRQLEELWDQTGGFGTLLAIKHDFDDTPKWKQSMLDLAEHVVPALPTAQSKTAQG